MAICRTCAQPFERPRRRGRPPVECPECKNKPKKAEPRISGVEAVDRLEAMLRSRGTHLSQQER